MRSLSARSIAGLLVTVLAAVGSPVAAAEWGVSTAIPTAGATSPMPAWTDFCARYGGECSKKTSKPTVIRLDAASMDHIAAANRRINASVKKQEDGDHWGVADRWDLPIDGAGDCEDFALLKRKLLIAEGFPRQALQMTVVYAPNNEGHTVLLARTDYGDYILDDNTDEVLPWCETPYLFVKKQSDTSDRRWEAILAPQPPRQCP